MYEASIMKSGIAAPGVQRLKINRWKMVFSVRNKDVSFIY